MNRNFLRTIFVRLVACVMVLSLGFGTMQALAWMRTPPAQRPSIERALRVEAIEVQPESVQVTLEGFGQVRALDVVNIAPEVAGKIVAVHPRLDVGEVIPESDILFEIDARDYESRRLEAEAQVAQLEQTITRWKTQLEIDTGRLTSLQRSRDLAKAEFDRLKTLFETDDVGTRSGVDAAERAFHAASDQLDQLGQAVALYPIQIEETQDALESAHAGLSMAKLSLDRTKVRAPFAARVKAVTLEVGQYVSPGPPVLTLANDSILEISVPLDSREAREWLRFKPGTDLTNESWFKDLEPVECAITWTDDERGPPAPDETAGWRGHVHRVEQFDEQSRTITVAIRVEGEEAFSTSASRVPLVDGMFCSVAIPGRAVDDVYRLPRYAVGFTGEIHVATGNSLGALSFDRSSIQDPAALAEAILEGQEPLSQYLRTRLEEPLQSAMLQVEEGQRAALEEAIALLDKSNDEAVADQRAAVDEVHAHLDAYLQAHSPEDRLVDVLIEQLNLVLQDDTLYEPARFEGVALTEEIKLRLEQPATAEERVRLNRSLLEAAYPNALGQGYRLETRHVEIVRLEGETTLVRGELSPGDYVITTRLVNPLQSTLLDVTVLDRGVVFAEVAAL